MTGDPTLTPTPGWRPPEEPTGPAPGVRYADHGARLVSYVVDALIAALLTGVVAIVLVFVLAASVASHLGLLAGGVVALLFLAVILIPVAYFPFFWVRGGQTPGMRMFGLRVVMDRDGGPVTLGPAILRLVGYWVDTVVLYLGFVWVLIDKRRRGWHDLIAGTVVIQGD
jgi:uncharacterized RDD family membrane protein YckC